MTPIARRSRRGAIRPPVKEEENEGDEKTEREGEQNPADRAEETRDVGDSK
jgi:hypothetical protein